MKQFMTFLLAWILATTINADCQDNSYFEIKLKSLMADSVRLVVNGKAFPFLLIQPHEDYLNLKLHMGDLTITTLQTLELQFLQLSNSNKLLIKEIVLCLNDSIYKFKGQEVRRLFNTNYFIEPGKFHNNVAEYKLTRFWKNPARLILNDKLSRIINNKRYSFTFKIVGKPIRRIYSSLYYFTRLGDRRVIQKPIYNNQDTTTFNIFSADQLSHFELFLGDHENEFYVEQVILIEDGTSHYLNGDDVTSNFILNEYIEPVKFGDSLVLSIITYQGKSIPYLRYFFDHNHQNRKIEYPYSYELTFAGEVEGKEDIISILVYDTKDSLEFQDRKIYYFPDSAIFGKFNFKLQERLQTFRLLFLNKQNTYLINKITVKENGRKVIWGSDDFEQKFEFQYLDYNFSEKGIFFKHQQKTGDSSINFIGPFRFKIEELKEEIILLIFFAITGFASWNLNNRFLLPNPLN